MLLQQGSYGLTGQTNHTVDFSVIVADGAQARLTLSDISIKGIGEPTIQLGDGSRLELELRGRNTLDKEGILAPASASLTIRGDGDLRINNIRNYAVGIGSSYNDPYGTIRLAGEGSISIHASGEKILCLGGGRSAGEGIQVLSGRLELVGNGVNVVALGSYAGTADIDIRNADVSIHGDGNEVLLAGSRTGAARIRAEDSRIRLSSACELLTGLGTMNGSADAVISRCTVNSDTHCDRGAVFGSFDGDAGIVFRESEVRLHGEGYRVSGFGSLNGKCTVRIESGEIEGSLLAVERMLLGNDHSCFIVTGGNIHLAQENTKTPVSPAGIPLRFAAPDGNHYEAVFRDEKEEWRYRADRDKDGRLGVWILPQDADT